MLSYHLDTALIAIPNYGLTGDEAEEIIERAFEFASALSTHLPIRFVIGSRAEDCLWSCGCGPQHDVVTQFLDMLGLSNTYSANDVAKTYQTLIDRCTRADDEELIEALEIDNFDLIPAIAQQVTPLALLRETQRVVATVALGASTETIQGIVPGWASAFAGEISVGTRITSVMPDNVLDEPIVLNIASECLVSPSDILALRKSDAIWKSSATDDEVHLAIAVKALEILKDANGDVGTADLEDFAIGSNFRASLIASQCNGDQPYSSACLTLCAQIVADRCNRYRRPMGQPNQIVRESDKALAWRVHLTDAHQALRLMYWKLGNKIEFANVGPKHELIIQEGSLGGGVSCDLNGLGLRR